LVIFRVYDSVKEGGKKRKCQGALPHAHVASALEQGGDSPCSWCRNRHGSKAPRSRTPIKIFDWIVSRLQLDGLVLQLNRLH
jgi:hypothetical protein